MAFAATMERISPIRRHECADGEPLFLTHVGRNVQMDMPIVIVEGWGNNFRCIIPIPALNEATLDELEAEIFLIAERSWDQLNPEGSWDRIKGSINDTPELIELLERDHELRKEGKMLVITVGGSDEDPTFHGEVRDLE